MDSLSFLFLLISSCFSLFLQHLLRHHSLLFKLLLNFRPSLHCSLCIYQHAPSNSSQLPLLPQGIVATSSNRQKHSAFRQLSKNLQLRKPRHAKRPQLPPGAVYNQIELYLNQLLFEQARDLKKLQKLYTKCLIASKFKTSYHYVFPNQPLKIRIPPQ